MGQGVRDALEEQSVDNSHGEQGDKCKDGEQCGQDALNDRTFIRRDKYAARAPRSGNTRYGMLMNQNLSLRKGNSLGKPS